MPELQHPDIVGNFLSSYGTAQAQQQAQQDRALNQQRMAKQDQRADQQFEMEMDANQLGMALKRADALNGILSQVNPADPMSLETAKRDFINTFGGDPKAVAGVTMDRVKELRAETDLKRRLLRTQIAAADRSNRPEPRGAAGPGGQVLPSNEQIDNEAKLRGEYTGQLKEFTQVRDAFGRVATAAQDPSAAGDLALIFNYMKMLDPGSVVREQEFANAQNAAGVPERIRAAYNNALKGERLTEATRTDFVDRASRLFENQLAGANKTREVYSGLAGQYGFDPSRVTPDLSLGVTTDITRPKAKPTFTGSGVLQDQSRSSAPVDSISAADALLGLK